MPTLNSKEYVAKGGNHCPCCNGVDICGGPIEIASGGAAQEVTCNQCFASWTDVYQLTGYTDLEEPE